MKWSKTELINQGNQELTINEAVTFDPESLASDRLRDLKNVTVTGSGHYDPSRQRFEADLKVTGDMVLSDGGKVYASADAATWTLVSGNADVKQLIGASSK